MLIITGDVHGEFWALNDLINKHSNLKVIINCGDFGWWPRATFDYYTKRENYKLKNHNVKIFWCDGNHEDFEDLKKYKVQTEVLPNVFYMPRGTVMQLPDKRKMLFIGGGLSIDRHLRVERSGDFGWFMEETISQADINNLPDEKIDIIISHTAPEYFDVIEHNPRYPEDPSRKALNYVYDKYKPDLWFCGHYHLYKWGNYNGCRWECLSAVGYNGRWWTELREEIY